MTITSVLGAVSAAHRYQHSSYLTTSYSHERKHLQHQQTTDMAITTTQCCKASVEVS